MNVEAVVFEYIYHMLKGVVLGFLLETLFLFPVLVLKRNASSYLVEADTALVNMFKHIGLVWFCVSVCYLAYEIFSLTDDSSQHRFYSRMTGPYWFAYWLTSPFMFLLTQLLWIKWFSSHWLPRLFIAVILVFSLFAEKIVVFLSSLHRDYLPSSWADYYNCSSSTIVLRAFLFIGLWALWFVGGRYRFGKFTKMSEH